MSTLRITSPAFGHNELIPVRFTCDAEDINPPLMIENVPSGTKSFALIMDDPDAPRGTWVHWVVWNIAPDTRTIPESSVPAGARQGINDFRRHAYGGPCPPSGTHRYFFKLYALDTVLNLNEAAAKAQLEIAMTGHVLNQAELVGLYKRR
jgi:Raf kinase inhibitor-like YbhB/YbcL family protein